MKAFGIRKYKEDPVFIEQPIPQVGDDEVLVEVHAVSINPLDSKIRMGELTVMLQYDMPLILGNDFSGVITEIGKNVTKFKVGDSVYGHPRSEMMGTFSEYISVNQADIALKPQSLSFEEAASVPLVGLTAYQVFNDILKLQSGQRILIHAGSGGVGTFAIQLAKAMGAYVATTSSSGVELAKSLGADEVINYKEENFEDRLKSYDAVLDTIGGQTLEKSFLSVREGGQVVSLSGPPNAAFAQKTGLGWIKKVIFTLISRNITQLEKEHKVDYHFYFMKHSGEQLELLSSLLEDGTVKPVIDQVFPFEEIGQALNYSETGRAKGKIVVRLK